LILEAQVLILEAQALALRQNNRVFVKRCPFHRNSQISEIVGNGRVVKQIKISSIHLKCCQTLIIFFFSPPDGPASGTENIL